MIYVAGPWRAPTAYRVRLNIRRAEAMALEVFKLGAVAVCVHTMCGNFEGELPDENWLQFDLELLARSDAMLLVPGWEASSGTMGERDFANAHGIPVLGELEALSAWIETWHKAGRP